MIVALALIGALFTVDNAEFLNQVEKNKADGMSWHYIGSTAPNANDPYMSTLYVSQDCADEASDN